MSGFRVDPAALISAADRMSDFEQHTEAQLSQLAAAQQQLGSAWDGAGGEAQRAAQQRLSEGIHEMRHALAELRRIAVTAHENYQGAIQTNTRNWG